MTTFVSPPTNVVGALPSVFAHLPRPATVSHRPVDWRKLAALGGLLAAPLAAGLVTGRAISARRGVIAGGLTALAIGVARLQLARWFTPEPAYQAEGRIGGLELRRYGARIEAAAEVDVPVLEQALDQGYRRLARYEAGANHRGETLRRAAPVITAMHDGRYVVSFIMPPGRTLASLPAPLDADVVLREVPGRAIAVLRFHGRFTRDNIAAHERALLEQVLDAGLSARGSVMFAAFDWPMTLPLLRRNELWLEVT